MALAAPALGPILWSTGTAIVTGIASYFYFKPDNSHPVSHSDHTDSKGEIFNNVQLAVEENNNQNGLLVSLVSILVFFKVIEVMLCMCRAYQKSIKRKYRTPTPIVSQVSNPIQHV